MNYLGQFSHPNLVNLIGYCLEDEHRLLVYEFMPRGSLENHLFRSKFFFSFKSFYDYILLKRCNIFNYCVNIINRRILLSTAFMESSVKGCTWCC